MSSLSSLKGPDSGQKTAIPKIPELPQSVVDRFPEMKDWYDDMEKWREKLAIILKGKAF